MILYQSVFIDNKRVFLYKSTLKSIFFVQKSQKSASGWGLSPQTPALVVHLSPPSEITGCATGCKYLPGSSGFHLLFTSESCSPLLLRRYFYANKSQYDTIQYYFAWIAFTYFFLGKDFMALTSISNRVYWSIWARYFWMTFLAKTIVLFSGPIEQLFGPRFDHLAAKKIV